MNPALRQGLPILLGIAVMLSLSMGMRQSLGLFMPPATQDLGIAVAQFTLAIAVQNLGWGVMQPFVGAAAARWGFRPVLVTGTVAYVSGLLVMGLAQSVVGLVLGAGVLIGLALACTGSGMALAAASRPVPPALRSTALGLVSAVGAAGALLAAPFGQLLAEGWGWRAGVLGFFLVGLAMIPAAWIGGRVDKTPLPPVARGESVRTGQALARAMTHVPFLVMAGAYMVCGLQLVFLTTHLPSYLALCGQDPMLSAKALGLIGAFNVMGSIFFGWAGGRWNKGALLGGIYVVRSLVIALYFAWAPSELSTLVFASIMGFLWLGVAPLISGMVIEMFGMRFQAMIQGIAFMSHQIGSFLGAFGGGVLFDLKGDYVLAWQLGVGMGLAAGMAQLIFALGGRRPAQPVPA